jgi:hypothetical protein
LICPRCGGPARVIAAITEPDVIRQILAHVGEPPARAPRSGGREPDEEDAGDQADRPHRAAAYRAGAPAHVEGGNVLRASRLPPPQPIWPAG